LRANGAEVYSRFEYIGQRDVQSALRLLLVRDMMYHRELEAKDVATEAGCTVSWLYSLTSGSAWYRMSVMKLDEWLDKIEDAITSLSDSKGGVYGSCRCDPRSIDGIREVLRHGVR